MTCRMLAVLRRSHILQLAVRPTPLPLVRVFGKAFVVSANSRCIREQNVSIQHDSAAPKDVQRVPAAERKKPSKKQLVVPEKERTTGCSVLHDSGCSEIRNRNLTSADTTRDEPHAERNESAQYRLAKTPGRKGENLHVRRRYTPAQRHAAISAVASGRFTVLEASRIHGIPANTIYKWWLEQQRQHMPPQQIKTRATYPKADVDGALALIRRLGSAAAASRELNINLRTLYYWRRRAESPDGSRTQRRVTRGYSAEERQMAVAALKASTLRKTGRKFEIPHTTIRDWAALASLKGKALARTAGEGVMS